jgi:2-polyprenyl-3-methyl-5-hydroxy-6-metoxy-1,4-benzoquinol methylase
MMRRCSIAELMDDPNLSREAHSNALEGLRNLNKLSSSSAILWTALTKMQKELFANHRTANIPNIQNGENIHDIQNIQKVRPLRVLDIATGSGDILIELCARAKALNQTDWFQFTGADISATAISIAEEKAKKAGAPIKFLQADVMKENVADGFDIEIISLFTHHLTPEGVQSLFKKVLVSKARVLLVNDLVRSELSYILVWLATRIVTRSEVVHFDGPASVRNSYTAQEMQQLAIEAGLGNCRIEIHWPCRQLLIWRRP